MVRHIFEWVGRDRCSIGEVHRRLNAAKEQTRTGKTVWDRATSWGLLNKPAYKGAAADRAKRWWNRCAHGYEHNEGAVCTRKTRLRPRTFLPSNGCLFLSRRWSMRLCVRPLPSNYRKTGNGLVPPSVEHAMCYRACLSGPGAARLSMANRSVPVHVHSMSVPTPMIAASAQLPSASVGCGCAGPSHCERIWSMKP